MYTEGFEKACQCNLRTYRLIFMDLNMPVMDGQEASKIILGKIEDKSQNFKPKLEFSKPKIDSFNKFDLLVKRDRDEDIRDEQILEVQIDSDIYLNPAQEELTHIVALTSYEGVEIMKECLSIGMKRMIHKPISS